MKNKNKKEKIHITDTVKDVIDVYFYDDKLKCFIMKDKSYMDIIQINTKDLVSASEDDIEYDIMRYIIADFGLLIKAVFHAEQENSKNISDTSCRIHQMKYIRDSCSEILMN